MTAYEVNHKIYMAGSFRKGAKRPVHHLMTSQQYQQYFNTYAAKGFRPDRISVLTRLNGPPLFTAIWAPKDGAFESYHAMTRADFLAKRKQMRQANYLIVDLAVYQDGNPAELRFAGTWVKKPFTDYATYINMSKSEFNKRHSEPKPKGFALTHLEPYVGENGISFAAIWEKRPGNWGFAYMLNGKEYQAQYNQYATQGYRLHQVLAAGNPNTNDDFISAVWVK